MTAAASKAPARRKAVRAAGAGARKPPGAKKAPARKKPPAGAPSAKREPGATRGGKRATTAAPRAKRTGETPPGGARADSKRRARAIDRHLGKAYPDARCSLDHRSPFELLVATILSAQCTDERVNMVTPALFRRFPGPGDFAGASLAEIEEHVRSTGFYRNKAKAIQGAATLISERFGGRVPATMEELLTLPGVARKTANVVLGTAFDQASGVVVDTHVQRVSRRLGLTTEQDPAKIERDLMALLPRTAWVGFSHRVIQHGRRVCMARKPRCADCPVHDLCPSAEL